MFWRFLDGADERLPCNVIHVLGFSGQVGSIVKLNSVFQVDAVFSYGSLVWIHFSDFCCLKKRPRWLKLL
jgi:hypothetical protein